MNWRRPHAPLRRRAAGAAGLIGAWNLYIAFNDDGIIEGEVRDRAGAPVAAPQ